MIKTFNRIHYISFSLGILCVFRPSSEVVRFSMLWLPLKSPRQGKGFMMISKPVAAQTSAVLLLAKSGVLRDKKYTFPKNNMISPDMFPEFKSGIYSGTGVVEDGNIITSGTYPIETKFTGLNDGTSELTSKLIQAIKSKN